MDEGAQAASPVAARQTNPVEENKSMPDTVMVSSSSLKQARPASAYMPIKALN